MPNTTNIHAAFTNATTLTAYIRANYREVLTHGGYPSTYFRAVRLCRRAAKMAGTTIQQIVQKVTT